MLLENIKICPICESDKSVFWKKINDWEIRSCSGCGLNRLDPRPVESELGKLYSENYFIDRKSRDIKKSKKQMSRSFRRRLCLIRRYSKGNTLLDAGCGEGDWLNYVSNKGFNAIGFDISDKAGKSTNCVVIKGAMCKVPIKGLYDVITCFHSLEHCENPVEALTWLSKYLNDNGIILIEVPNCGSYDAIHYDILWDG